MRDHWQRRYTTTARRDLAPVARWVKAERRSAHRRTRRSTSVEPCMSASLVATLVVRVIPWLQRYLCARSSYSLDQFLRLAKVAIL